CASPRAWTRARSSRRAGGSTRGCRAGWSASRGSSARRGPWPPARTAGRSRTAGSCSPTGSPGRSWRSCDRRTPLLLLAAGVLRPPARGLDVRPLQAEPLQQGAEVPRPGRADVDLLAADRVLDDEAVGVQRQAVGGSLEGL